MIEVARLHVKIVRLQVAELRRERIDAVVRDDDGLRILELREHTRCKDVLVMWGVTLTG